MPDRLMMLSYPLIRTSATGCLVQLVLMRSVPSGRSTVNSNCSCVRWGIGTGGWRRAPSVGSKFQRPNCLRHE